MDPHTETAIALFGDPHKRSEVKPINHGWNYGLGQKKMIASGFNPAVVREFFDKMQSQFPVLMDWRERICEIDASGEYLDNGFGRLMRCNPARAYTQAPALMGQGTARDIMCEGLLHIPHYIWPYLRVMVHDEIVASAPRKTQRNSTRSQKGPDLYLAGRSN